MKSTTAAHVIKVLKEIFARFGLPNEIVSDQGPPFDSDMLMAFAREWDIVLNPSSPLYPRSNGLVERYVQTLKASLTKALQTGGDISSVLLDYHASPMDGLPSPAEMLMGRKLRTRVPMHPDLLQPKFECKQILERLRL